MTRTMERLAPRSLPLVFQWRDEDKPLPRRKIQIPPRSRMRTLGLEAPPWIDSGPLDQPFDFCKQVESLCQSVVQHTPELRHIDVSRLLFGVTQARSGKLHGLQARVTPLRFRRGELVRQRNGVCYQVQRYFVNRREMLYLVTFCLPRFLNQSFEDKFVTIFHELFHISPMFDGDLRRHKGRYCLHSHSKHAYDSHMADLARRYLAQKVDPRSHDFLRMDFAQLVHRHGSVSGVFVPRPRLLPIQYAAADR